MKNDLRPKIYLSGYPGNTGNVDRLGKPRIKEQAGFAKTAHRPA